MLTLTLAAPHLDPSLVVSDPDQVEDWLRQLPFAQPFDSAVLMRDALAQLNCTRLAAGARLHVLRRYLQALERILPVLELEARPGELSSLRKARQAALTAQHLSLLMHNGFKQLVLERSAEHGLFHFDKHKIEALNLALLSARQLAFLYARSYTALPQGFWLDLHQLYQYVLANNWQDKALNEHEDSLGALYRQLLLLGLTACNRMDPGQIGYALLLVRKHAGSLHLTTVDKLPAQHGAFLFLPQQDAPPRFFDAMPAGVGSCWTLDTAPLQQELMDKLIALQRLAQNHSDDVALAEEIQRVLQLMQGWQSTPHRRHSRQQSGEMVEVVSLLPACWFAANHASWDFPLPLLVPPPPQVVDDGITVDGEDGSDIPSLHLLPPPPPARLQVVNISASGMLLAGEALQHPLRAGELLLLRSDGKPWQLAVVRWLNLRGEGMAVECGVEQVGLTPEAVMIKPVITHPRDHYRMALRLPALPRLGRPPMLVLPGRQYQKLREFQLHDRDGETLVRSVALDFQTAYYQFVEYRPSSEF